MVEEIESHILKRYDLLTKQGKGAYGHARTEFCQKLLTLLSLRSKNVNSARSNT